MADDQTLPPITLLLRTDQPQRRGDLAALLRSIADTLDTGRIVGGEPAARHAWAIDQIMDVRSMDDFDPCKDATRVAGMRLAMLLARSSLDREAKEMDARHDGWTPHVQNIVEIARALELAAQA